MAKRKAIAPHRYRPAAILAGYAGRAVGSYARRKLGQYVDRKTSAKKEASNVITGQYNYATVYSKRRRARRRTSKFTRFSRSVKRVIWRELGANQFVIQNNYSGVANANAQGCYGITLLGLSGDAGGQANDCFRCFDKLYGPGAGAVATAKLENAKLTFTSAVVDFAFRNKDDSPTIDLDVYTLMCRKDVPRVMAGVGTGADGLIHGHFLQCLKQGINTDQTALTTLAPNTFGVTPFQSSQFCSYWTVMNKKKFILGTGQVANYQYRTKRSVSVYGNDLVYNNALTSALMAKRGVTVGFLFVVNGVVKNGDQPACGFEWSSTKTMNCKLLSSNIDTVSGA